MTEPELLPEQREDDSYRSALGRTGAVDGAGGTSGQRGDGAGDDEIRAADYEAGARTERNGVKEKFSMETPTEETRFSQGLSEPDAPRKENERLKGRAEHWKGQLKRTTPETGTLAVNDDMMKENIFSAACIY